MTGDLAMISRIDMKSTGNKGKINWISLTRKPLVHQNTVLRVKSQPTKWKEISHIR